MLKSAKKSRRGFKKDNKFFKVGWNNGDKLSEDRVMEIGKKFQHNIWMSIYFPLT